MSLFCRRSGGGNILSFELIIQIYYLNACGVLGFNRKVRREFRKGRGVLNAAIKPKTEAFCFIKSAELKDHKACQKNLRNQRKSARK
jgi:hypothetical protein